MAALLIALLAVLVVVVALAVWLEIRTDGHTASDVPLIEPTPVAPPTPQPLRAPQPRLVVLVDEELPDEYPKAIQVMRVGHRIWDQRGEAWDRHGSDHSGRPVYRRALGQGVIR